MNSLSLPHSSGQNGRAFFLNTFYIFLLFFFASGVSNPFKVEELPHHVFYIRGDVTMQIIWVVLYLFGLILIVRSRRDVLSALRSNILIVVLIGYVFLSILWSPFTDLSLRRGVAVALTTAMGIYLGSKQDFGNLVKIMAWSYGFIIILCILVLLFFTGYGTQDIGGSATAFKGIYGHKNTLGYNMVFSFVAWSWIYFSKLYKPVIPLFFMFASAALLIPSHSMTSILIFLFILYLYVMYVIFTFDKMIFAGVASIATALMIYLIVSVSFYISDHSLEEFFVDILRRDITVSSRTIIWKAVWLDILKQFWFGYGFAGYWPGTGQSLAFLFKDLDPQEITSAHNGLFETWLNIGFTGVLLLLAYYFQTLFRLFHNMIRDKNDMSFLFMFLFVSAFTLYNSVENHVFFRNSIIWILFVSISVQLGLKGKQEARV